MAGGVRCLPGGMTMGEGQWITWVVDGHLALLALLPAGHPPLLGTRSLTNEAEIGTQSHSRPIGIDQT